MKLFKKVILFNWKKYGQNTKLQCQLNICQKIFVETWTFPPRRTKTFIFVCVDTLNLTDNIVNSLVQLRLWLRWPRILAVSAEINVKVVLLNFRYTQTQKCRFYFHLFTWKLFPNLSKLTNIIILPQEHWRQEVPFYPLPRRYRTRWNMSHNVNFMKTRN